MKLYKDYVAILEDEIEDLVLKTVDNDELIYESECELHVMLENRKHILEMIAEHEENKKLSK